MTMTCLLSCCLTVTFCSLVETSFLLSCAFARSRWIASITSGCWASTASPSALVQSSFSLIIASTVGVAASALTLSSHALLVDLGLERVVLQLLVLLAASGRPAPLPADRSMRPAGWPAVRRDIARSAPPAHRAARASATPVQVVTVWCRSPAPTQRPGSPSSTPTPAEASCNATCLSPSPIRWNQSANRSCRL